MVRAVRSEAPEDRSRLETDLGLAAAAVSDVGLRHHRNEDAYRLASVGERVAVVVCDGVSSTANPHLASEAAAGAAMAVLQPLLDLEEWPGDEDLAASLGQAVAAAQQAASDVDQQEEGGFPGAPSTTLVIALVGPSGAMTTSVGDSRAYWLGAAGPEDAGPEAPAGAAPSAPTGGHSLTVDDSWAEAAISSGVPSPLAYAAPQSHVITAWLGSEGPPIDAVARPWRFERPGLVIVCSDGLWNYFERPAELAEQVAEAPESSPIGVARHLTQAALDAGGGDNITVAVVPVTATPTPTPTPTPEPPAPEPDPAPASPR